MTNEALDLESELADLLGETTTTNNGGMPDLDFRQNVPTGTVLGSTSVEGGVIQITKGDSMVRLNGRSLPERTKVYDTRTGVPSMVPTAQLRYQLGKRRQDGTKVYALRLPEGIEQPVPIKDTCKICYVNRGNRHRNFYSEDQLMNHMVSFHSLEWAAMERQREIDSRREDGNRLERLMITMMTAMNPEAAKKLPKEVRDQIADLQQKAGA